MQGGKVGKPTDVELRFVMFNDQGTDAPLLFNSSPPYGK